MTAVATGAVWGLEQRTRVCAATLGLDPGGDPAALLDNVARRVQHDEDDASLWLLMTTLAGAFPTAELMRACRRGLRLVPPSHALGWLLRASVTHAVTSGSPDARMEVVADDLVLDISATLSSPDTLGVDLLAQWSDRPVRPVVWTDRQTGFRIPAAREGAACLVVPWRTAVLVPHTVTTGNHSERLAALGEFSGSDLVLIGHDCLPVVAAELVESEEIDRFGSFLEVVKQAALVVGVSDASAQEFRGFVAALTTQGIAGPAVSACLLPTHVADPPGEASLMNPSGDPRVFVADERLSRSNTAEVLVAAEDLWRRGLSFSLSLAVGTLEPACELSNVIELLQAAGRPIDVLDDSSTASVHEALERASFSVVASLHEGFSPAVVASLSHGVPVIASSFGSSRELAEGHGAILIDPESPTEIADAMESLLTDGDRLAELRRDISNRPVRSWSHYANELWEILHERTSLQATAGRA